jgi:hypothetical protein
MLQKFLLLPGTIFSPKAANNGFALDPDFGTDLPVNGPLRYNIDNSAGNPGPPGTEGRMPEQRIHVVSFPTTRPAYQSFSQEKGAPCEQQYLATNTSRSNRSPHSSAISVGAGGDR